MILRVGLTGGIGSGKSTVANLFADKNVAVIDADVITRNLVAPGEPALAEIAETLGKEFLSDEGYLHRTKLREVIFKNDTKRKQLEAILHPRVEKVVATEVAALKSPYCIIVIPLLFEVAQEHLVDRVLVIDAPKDAQIARVTARDKTSSKNVEQIMASQLNRELRLSRADDVITNDKDKLSLLEQVNRLHERYLQMAS